MPRGLSSEPWYNFALGVCAGRLEGFSAINKFGCAPSIALDITTDVWDGADQVTSTAIWVAPTQARVHSLVSSDAADDGNPLGTGLRTVRVFGLVDWDTPEVTEDITLDGTAVVETVNSYVIVHRMQGLTFGSGGTNAGLITATADVDGTITAVMQPDMGQTAMAIYGIPSGQALALVGLFGTVLRLAGIGVKIDGTLQVKENADRADSAFITKEIFQFNDTMPLDRPYNPFKLCRGPCIVKVQATPDKVGVAVSAVFDAYTMND